MMYQGSLFSRLGGAGEKVTAHITPSNPLMTDQLAAPYCQANRYDSSSARANKRPAKVGHNAVCLTQDKALLSLLLSRLMKPDDADVLAATLVEHFGDFASVICASDRQLIPFSGITEAIISDFRLIEASTYHFSRVKMQSACVLSHWSDVIKYLRVRLARQPVEQFRVLFLDNKNQLVADECFGTGTVNQVHVYPREIVKRGLDLNASHMVLAHNHPSGDAGPSDNDILMTHAVQKAAACLGITVYDHIIVASHSHISFREQGLLC